MTTEAPYADMTDKDWLNKKFAADLRTLLGLQDAAEIDAKEFFGGKIKEGVLRAGFRGAVRTMIAQYGGIYMKDITSFSGHVLINQFESWARDVLNFELEILQRERRRTIT